MLSASRVAPLLALAACAVACASPPLATGIAPPALTEPGEAVVTVNDDSGAPIPGAYVWLCPAHGSSRPSSVTDTTGTARFQSVPRGEYTAHAALGGFLEAPGTTQVHIGAPVVSVTVRLTVHVSTGDAFVLERPGGVGPAPTPTPFPCPGNA